MATGLVLNSRLHLLLLKSKTGGSHKVYMYTFNHRTSGNPWPSWTGDALHGYEIDHVFGVPHRRENRDIYSDEERTLSDRMIKFWTNFAKTGYVSGNGGRNRSHVF